MPSITDVNLQHPHQVNKDWKITPQSLRIDFTVSVENPGCYAIAVTLRDDDNLTHDDVIASNLANVCDLPCICFGVGETKKFSINGGEGPMPTPKAGRTQLKPVYGQWPVSDGPFDDTLELYVTIELYFCKYGPCAESGETACDPLNCGKIGNYRPLATFTSKGQVNEIEIIDGTGWSEGMGLIQKSASAGTSLVPKVASSEMRAPSDPYVAVMLRQRAKLEKQMRALQQQIEALKRQQESSSG